MVKRRSASKRTNEPNETQMQRTRTWVTSGLTALLLATAAVLLTAYKSELMHVVGPWVSDAFAWTEDHVRPMPDDKLVGINLRFWDPSDADREQVFEALSITIGPKQCRQPGGYKFTRIFGDRDFNPSTYALVHVSCRASGRVAVTLIPRSGAAATVYDGHAKEWEQLPFPGVKGSYSYGDVVVTMLDLDLPAGPRRAAN